MEDARREKYCIYCTIVGLGRPALGALRLFHVINEIATRPPDDPSGGGGGDASNGQNPGNSEEPMIFAGAVLGAFVLGGAAWFLVLRPRIQRDLMRRRHGREESYSIQGADEGSLSSRQDLVDEGELQGGVYHAWSGLSGYSDE